MGKAPFMAFAALTLACGAAGLPVEDLPGTDSGTSDADRGTPVDAGPSGTRLVVVHTGEPKLQPFRVCVDDTEVPQPSDPSRPMPKSNYPGIAIGGAAYVGQVAPGPLSLRLYDALTLASLNRATETCGTLRNDTTFPQFAHEDVDTTGVVIAADALNLVGVYGSVGQSKAVSAVLDPSFPTASDPLEIALGHLSPDHQTTKITGAFSARDGGASVTLDPVAFGAVGSLTKTTFSLDASASSYDDYGIAMTSPPQFFSLTDVAQATDSTQAPSTLLGGRSHFAFVLVGYDIVPDGGSPEQLLHLVAIGTPQ